VVEAGGPVPVARLPVHSSRRGPLRHRNFSARHFRPAVQTASLTDELRFRDLQYTCTTLLIAAGCHLQEVKTYLGHSSIRVTSDRYGHVSPKAGESMRDRLQDTYTSAEAETSADFIRIVKAESDSSSAPERTHLGSDLR
jgi:integrase